MQPAGSLVGAAEPAAGDGTTTSAGAGDGIAAAFPLPAPSYWLTRFLILRLLGLVYFVAFLSLARQVVPLIGDHGLLPAPLFLDQVARTLGSRTDAFLRLPSLFWFAYSERLMVTLAWVGAGLSLLVLAGLANAILLLALWALYMSFVHIGQLWYGYGWEIQLLETGFLATFLCPLFDPRPFPRRAPSAVVITLFRWLIFRIMLGAGLIKLRGDACWRDFTCLYYHYETQPIPNPVSRWLHFLPKPVHRLGVLFNHLSELVAPWFAFGPRRARHLAGGVLLAFQITLIVSGNLSFLNWLTIVPILACFDDALLSRVLPRRLGERARLAAQAARPSRAQNVAVAALALAVGALSVFPVLNMLSPRQAMNTSFDPLALVNTYGAFGSVGKERDEIVFEGTREADITATTQWREYEFPCKPGDPQRRPCVISPYHYRLDWQIWFAAMASPREYPWTVHFAWKLLHNDPGTLRLLVNDPFPGEPPRYVRALLYRYRFSRSAAPGDPGGAWWHRSLLGEWLPPLAANDPALRRFLAAHGWLPGGDQPG